VHRIGVRAAVGGAELYHVPSDTRFVSRGANYAHFGVPAGESATQDVTFNVGSYDAAGANAALQELASYGYNTVRILLNGACATGCLGDSATADDLSDGYVANVVDFLGKARANGVQVIVAVDAVPAGTSYATQVSTSCCAQFAGANLDFLTTGGVNGNAAFWTALVGRLTAQENLRETILSYELRRQAFYRSDETPLSLSSGSVATANGQSYDLAVAAQRQALMDENLVNWSDTMRAAIRAADPTALVSVGFIWPHAPNSARSGDPRVSRMRYVLDNSALDFLSPRVYPGLELTLAQYVENYELPAVTGKPVLMAELGAPTATYSTAGAAAEALQTWQAQSCALGFDGWLLWTWDADDELSGEPEVWNAQAAGGLVERALAPSIRTDPCASPNVALGKSAYASGAGAGTPAADAVDGRIDTLWNAGAPPGAWIELDLGTVYDLSMLRLVVAQTPAGQAVHKVWGKATSGASFTELYELDASTSDGQVVEIVPGAPWTGVRYLRIETIWGPSWPAWREIQAFPVV
jgi:F5/8 type C domain